MTSRAPTLVELRRFLVEEGCALEPWSSPEAVVRSLHDLLAHKRDDERFWARLKELSRRLDARDFDARGLPDFEVLGPAAIDRLVDELRGSVGPSRSRSVLDWLRTGAGLGAILVVVLGLALSCADEEPADIDAPWSPDAWQCDVVADGHGITDEAERDALCQLGDYVKGAAVTDSTMRAVLDCIPGYDAAWRADLLDQFENATAEELNALLVDLIGPGGDCEDYGYTDDDDDAFHDGGGCDISTH